jgi:hypothetical protein
MVAADTLVHDRLDALKQAVQRWHRARTAVARARRPTPRPT